MLLKRDNFLSYLVLSAQWVAAIQREEAAKVFCGGPDRYWLRLTLLLVPNLLWGRNQSSGTTTFLAKVWSKYQHLGIFYAIYVFVRTASLSSVSYFKKIELLYYWLKSKNNSYIQVQLFLFKIKILIWMLLRIAYLWICL